MVKLATPTLVLGWPDGTHEGYRGQHTHDHFQSQAQGDTYQSRGVRDASWRDCDTDGLGCPSIHVRHSCSVLWCGRALHAPLA